MLPRDWENSALDGSAAKVIDCKHRTPKYVDNGVPLVSPGTIKWGPIDLVSPKKRVSDEEYESLMDHCTVEVGDLVLSRNQSIGIASYVESDAPFVLGQDTVLVKPDSAEPKFLFYILQSTEVQREIFKLSGGSTFSRINLGDIRKLKFGLPPYKEQKKIAEILTVWDKAILTVEKLIESSKKQKTSLMEKLLTGNKRLPGFSDDWKKKKLGDLLDYKQPTPYLVSSTEYSSEYTTPVLTAGKTFILGYTNEEFGIYQDNLPAIIFDDFTTESKFVDFPFKAKSSAMKILSAKKGVSIKFVYEAMQMINYPLGGHQRHWISIYSNLVIGLPEYEEQKAISSVLSRADDEIGLLRKKLNCLKQEKKALMQQLLTGKKRVKIN